MRGKRAKPRELKPDSQFNSILVSRFINYVMLDGKKSTAEGIVHKAIAEVDLKGLQKIYAQQLEAQTKESKAPKKADKSAELTDSKTDSEKINSGMKEKGTSVRLNPLKVFELAVENIKPRVEIRSRRIGGANYQIPVPVNPRRQEALALRWLVAAMRDSRSNADSAVTLRREIESAFKGEGAAVTKRNDTHRMADANKAFAQFAR